MPNHLLIPLDRTATSAAVLPLARALATATGARVTLLRVTPAWEVPNTSWQDDQPADLSQAAASLRRAGVFAEATIRRVMRGDQVAPAIAGEARARRADLIVMVTHVRAGPERVARESVADQVLRLSPVPVLLLGPDGAQGDLHDTILAPVDGSPPGNAALELVAGLARLLKAEVVVLRVVTTAACRQAVLLDGAEAIEEERSPGVPGTLADAQHQVDWLAARLRGWGIVAQGRAVFGELPNTILETADRIAAGLIVMSTHARRAPAWAAPDSLGITVARLAHQPTLLVRHDPQLARPAGGRSVAVGAAVLT